MNEHYQSSGTGFEDKESEILLRMTRPDIYRVNAFRVLQLPVTASAREVSARLRKLDLTEKLGDTRDAGGGILPLATLSDGDSRREAGQRLNDPRSRLIDELFWFWPLSPSVPEDMDAALAALKRDGFSDAVSIWKRHEVEGSDANVSMHNLAIMYHALALDLEHAEARQALLEEQVQQKRDYWKQAFARWQILLSHDGFWQRLTERVRELDDPRLTVGTARRIRAGLPLILLSINAAIAVQAAHRGNHSEMRYHTALMSDSGFDKSVVEEAMRQAVATIRDRIKIICSNEDASIRKAPQHADQVAHNVIGQTSRLLLVLEMLLPKGHATNEVAHDEVALLILKSQIAFGNETGNWTTPLMVLGQALEITSSTSARRSIEDNINGCREALLYTTCWFCGAGSPDYQSRSEVEMHGNVTRSGGYIHWQRITVGVPRCQRCKSAHDRKRAIFGGMFTRLPRGVNPESTKKQFSKVKAMLSEGWALGEKPPGVS